jgi:curved DNA-binding protein CbpA
MANHYEVLGVTPQASANEVKQAYFRLVREKHPDRFPDPAEKARAQEVFKDITAAYNALSSERSRKEYDKELERPQIKGPEEIARDAFQRGQALMGQRQFHDAVELFRAAAHHVPGEARYHAALALALAQNPHWMREAIGCLEQAIDLQPKVAAYHGDLARLLLAQGLRVRARRAIETALKLAPGDPRLLDLAAEIGGGEAPPAPPERRGLTDLFRRK